jgi:hypothetical protein
MKTQDFIKESAEKYEYSDEVGMVKNNLHTLVRDAVELAKSLKENENIPEWCQEKISAAKGMLDSVTDYLKSQHEMGHQPEVPGFDTDSAERMFAESLKEDATGGASCSGAVASVVKELGGDTKELIKRQKSYTNVKTTGSDVKSIKQAKAE